VSPNSGICILRWVWESQADGSFTVFEDTDGEPLERGTEIRIHLKEEASEYADEDKLKVSTFWCPTRGLGNVSGLMLWFLSQVLELSTVPV
jgi:hypothetical protein